MNIHSKEPLQEHFAPDYSPIPLEVEQLLVEELIEGIAEIQSSDARYCLVTVGPFSKYANLARSLESEVFFEFFHNDSELMKDEYGPYENASKFFMVIDRKENRKAGVMRLLHDSEHGFKAIKDVKSMGLTDLSEDDILASLGVSSTGSTIEIATIAASPVYRGRRSDQLVSAAMYRALYQYCLSGNYTDLVAVIDSKPLQNLHDIYLPVSTTEEVKSPFEYLNAKENSLIHIPIGDIEGFMKGHDVATFDFLLGKPGLDPFCALSFTEQ